MIAAAFTTMVSYLLQAIITFLGIKYILKPEHYLNPAKLQKSILIVFFTATSYYLIRELDLNIFLDLLLKTGLLMALVVAFFNGTLTGILGWVKKR
jgi:hypothetical protein